MKSTYLLPLLGSLVITSHSQGAAILRITEIMAQSGAGGTGTPDWFEVSNLGDTSLSIVGYRMDDSSNSFATAVALNLVSDIGAGETVVFLETNSDADITTFRSFWNVPLSVQIGRYSGSGVGLSASGDGVNLFTSTGEAVTGASYSSATTGATFEFSYDSTGAALGGATPSSVGVNGAYLATGGPNDVSNIGSPGVIPEPSAAALALLPGFAFLLRRRA